MLTNIIFSPIDKKQSQKHCPVSSRRRALDPSVPTSIISCQVIFTARKRSLRRLCFYTCLSFYPQGGHAWLLPGGCMVAPPPGMHGCSRGVGVRGCSRGACVVALGGCMVAWGACMVTPRGHVWLLPGGMCGCSQGDMCGCSWGGCVCGCSQGGCAWDTMRYGDTINEWVVRILLECILVADFLYTFPCTHNANFCVIMGKNIQRLQEQFAFNL